MDEPDPADSEQAKQLERRAAQAMVAAYVQVAHSVQLAHWLQQTRERSLERRADRSGEMREILALQHQIDAQQPQAAILASANGHLRSQATNLARFARAGLTLADFERMGVANVMDLEELKGAIEREVATPSGETSGAAAPSGDGSSAEASVPQAPDLGK